LETYTPYDTCLPPCIEGPLLACIGAATSCQKETDQTCWNSGAYQQTFPILTIIDNMNSQLPTTESSFYARDGSICLRIESGVDADGSAQSSYYDASGTLLGSSVQMASTGNVWSCGGQRYLGNATDSPACTNDPRTLLALGEGCSSFAAPSCP
jgi:hypothetical protein